MRFTIPEDNTMTSIPGNSGLPPKVSKGKTPVRPPNTVGAKPASSGNTGGAKGLDAGSNSNGPSLGHNGSTTGPAGSRNIGFKGSPPATNASNGNKSARDKSNPYCVSSSAFVPGMGGGGKK